MWVYLLKFIACITLLLIFYKLVLEATHQHHFKRYFLLFTFILSLGIPLITFTQYIIVLVDPTSSTPLVHSSHELIPAMQTDNFPIILRGIYALGVVILTIRLLANLR